MFRFVSFLVFAFRFRFNLFCFVSLLFYFILFRFVFGAGVISFRFVVLTKESHLDLNEQSNKVKGTNLNQTETVVF